MPDYSKGKIYKIVCNTTGLVYIGSTCEPTLARRLAGHRSTYKSFLNGEKRYITSAKILENNNYEIVLIENISCHNKDELYARERYFIENIECVNKVIPTRTDKEWTLDNKERLKDYKKEYAEANKEDIRKKKHLYSQENKEKLKIYKLKYNEENIDKVKEQQRLKYLNSKAKKLLLNNLT
jgi:hypothetical protein